MDYLVELVAEVAAYAHAGRVGVGQFGVAGFELHEFVHEGIKGLVADDRGVLDVVTVVVFVKLFAELEYALGFVHV